MPSYRPNTRRPQKRRRARVPTARVVEKYYRPINDAQRAIWRSQAKIVAAVSGHFGGKSHVGAYWLLDQIKKNPGHDFIVCGPTYNNLQNSAIPKLRSLFALWNMPWEYDQHRRQGFRSQNNEYWLPGGGVIYFRSADRPGSMQGAHCKAFWMDEVVDTSFYVYETLRGRIAGMDGRGLITSTPYDRGWLYEHVFQKWQEQGGKERLDWWYAHGAGEHPLAKTRMDYFNADVNDQFFVAQWKSIDNTFFPKKEWESMQAMLPAWRFRMLYEGEFEKPMGLVYDCFQDYHYIEPFDIPPHWPRILGLDWGFKDPLACIWLAQAPNGKLYAYDEYYQSGWMRYETRDKRAEKGAMSMPQEMVQEIIDRMKSRHEIPSGIYCDSADPDMVLWTRDRCEVEMDGFNKVWGAAKGAGSIMAGITRNYMNVKGNELYVFNTLNHFKDEVSRYSWQTDKVTGEVLDKLAPIDRNNHLMDAWRYAFAGSPDEKFNSFGFGHIDPYDPFSLKRLYNAQNA